MKILLITEWFLPHHGGTETIFYNLIKNAPEDSYIVYAPHMSACSEFDRKQPFSIERSKIWARSIGHKNLFFRAFVLLCLYARSLWLIYRHKVDFVFFGSLHLYMGIWADVINTLVNKPSLAFVFGEEVQWIFHDQRFLAKVSAQFIRSALKNTDLLIAGSGDAVTRLVAWGTPRERIIKNLPCVDPSRFRPGLDVHSLAQRFHLENKKIILTVCRLEERKGVDLVIKALPDIFKCIPDAVFLVVGSGTKERKLRLLTSELQLSERVIFVGEIDPSDLPLYYNMCEVFIMANHIVKEWKETEGFGIVFIEANACAKPVIGGRSGGVADAIVDNVTGLLINPENKQEIVDSLVSLLTNRELAERLGRNGRGRVEREFQWPRYVDTIRKTTSRLVKLRP